MSIGGVQKFGLEPFDMLDKVVTTIIFSLFLVSYLGVLFYQWRFKQLLAESGVLKHKYIGMRIFFYVRVALSMPKVESTNGIRVAAYLVLISFFSFFFFGTAFVIWGVWIDGMRVQP